jgi:hypothetical protein
MVKIFGMLYPVVVHARIGWGGSDPGLQIPAFVDYKWALVRRQAPSGW